MLSRVTRTVPQYWITYGARSRGFWLVWANAECLCNSKNSTSWCTRTKINVLSLVFVKRITLVVYFSVGIISSEMRLFEAEYRVREPVSPTASNPNLSPPYSSPRTPSNYSPTSPEINPRKKLVECRSKYSAQIEEKLLGSAQIQQMK